MNIPGVFCPPTPAACSSSRRASPADPSSAGPFSAGPGPGPGPGPPEEAGPPLARASRRDWVAPVGCLAASATALTALLMMTLPTDGKVDRRCMHDYPGRIQNPQHPLDPLHTQRTPHPTPLPANPPPHPLTSRQMRRSGTPLGRPKPNRHRLIPPIHTRTHPSHPLAGYPFHPIPSPKGKCAGPAPPWGVPNPTGSA